MTRHPSLHTLYYTPTTTPPLLHTYPPPTYIHVKHKHTHAHLHLQTHTPSYLGARAHMLRAHMHTHTRTHKFTHKHTLFPPSHTSHIYTQMKLLLVTFTPSHMQDVSVCNVSSIPITSPYTHHPPGSTPLPPVPHLLGASSPTVREKRMP
jgi:hypothetical protein